MKKNVLFTAAMLSACFTFSQTPVDTCITIEVKSDALVTDRSDAANNNYGNHQDMMASAWTYAGDPIVARSLLLFDFSMIPAGATITSADMNLYYHVSPHGNPAQSSMSGPNTAYLRRVSSPWTELGVTWNNQPGISTVNQVTLAQSTSASQDYLGFNVLSLVEDIRNSGNNYGMMFQLQNESYYRCMIFASKDDPNNGLHPTMDICYTYYVGTENIHNQPDIKVYPNPVANQVMVSNPALQAPGTYQVMLCNQTGQQVDISSGLTYQDGGFSIDVNMLPAGVYFIHITGNGISAHKKLIKD